MKAGFPININTLNPPPNFKTIGHRGAGKLAPENTLASFKKAKELGLNWVEFDIQPIGFAGSIEWVVIHDETLDRTTDGHGLVTSLSISELKNLDAGSWMHSNFANERIPLLSEALKMLDELNIQPNIEIKIPTQSSRDSIERWVKALILYINQHWPIQKPNPLISSFNREVLIAFQKLAPSYPLGYLVEEWHPNLANHLQKHGFFSLHCDHNGFTFAQLEALLKNSFPVLLYTVDDSRLAQIYFDLGISAIFSDLLAFSSS